MLYFTDLVRIILHSVCDIGLVHVCSVDYNGRGCACAVISPLCQLLHTYVIVMSQCLKCCLLTLLTLFSLQEARQLAGKKHMISCGLNINIHVAIRHQLHLELEKFFHSQLRKPCRKRSKLAILEVLPV